VLVTQVVGLLLELWGGAFVIGWGVSNGSTLAVGAGLFLIGWSFGAWAKSFGNQPSRR